ncbi:hypothetical protein S83_066105, partial [Arachis hypogaea]
NNGTIGPHQSELEAVSILVLIKVLYSVIRVQSLLFAKAVPVPDDCIDPQWKWFKGCLGALGGTYIDETVSEKDKLRYRTRK